MGCEGEIYRQSWEYDRMYFLLHHSDLRSLRPVQGSHNEEILWLFCYHDPTRTNSVRHYVQLFWYCLKVQWLWEFPKWETLYECTLVHVWSLRWISLVVFHTLLAVECDSEDNSSVRHALESLPRWESIKFKSLIVLLSELEQKEPDHVFHIVKRHEWQIGCSDTRISRISKRESR